MIPGTDEETLDGFSLEAIQEIIQEISQFGDSTKAEQLQVRRFKARDLR